MNTASIIGHCKAYTRTAVNLIKHPFETIQFLLTLDGGDYVLYAFPIIVLTIYNGILTTLSRSVSYIPYATKVFLTTGIWSTIVTLTIGYIGWRIWMYILWNALQFVGGTGDGATQRIGLLHITLAVYIVQAICTTILFLTNLITGFGIATMVNLVLIFIFAITSCWSVVLSIKFLKELNNISYGKTILGMLLPSLVCLAFLLFMVSSVFH